MTPTPSTTTPRTVAEADFEASVLKSPVPVLVDFHAEWCAPCRGMAPGLEQLAAELGDAAVVAKVDIDANPELAERYGVRSIPTLVFIQDGAEVDRVVGAVSKDALASRLGDLT